MSQLSQPKPSIEVLTPSEIENSDSYMGPAEIPVSKWPLELLPAPKRVKLNTPDISAHNSSPEVANGPQTSPMFSNLSRLGANNLGEFGMFNNPIIIGSPEKPILPAVHGGKTSGIPFPMSHQSIQQVSGENVTSLVQGSSVVFPQAPLYELTPSQSLIPQNQPLMVQSQTPMAQFQTPIFQSQTPQFQNQNSMALSQPPTAQIHTSGQLYPAQQIPSEVMSQTISNIPLRTPITQPINGPSKKQIEKMEKQKQRELERLEREAIKELEREVKRQERERKDRERQLKREQAEKEKERRREEEKAKREEKRIKMEEEKRRKEEERKLKEGERKQKEEEKKQKEENRKRKEEQKDRSQMKISSFFAVKPVKTHSRPATPKNSTPPSLESSLVLYSRQFLPFFIKQNVVMAPASDLRADELTKRISSFDAGIKGTSPRAHLSDLVPSQRFDKHISYTSVQQLVDALNSSTTEKQLQHLVEILPPIKYLQFYENSKPPYIGTWCSEIHLSTNITQLNPLEMTLTGYDYNYDSDLDWDGDDDEGEDIDDLEDGDDDDDEANDDDDMEDFVDDNNEVTKRRRPIGSISPVSRWNYNTEEDKAHFDDLKYERLDYDIQFPIDPLCNYWSGDKVSVSVPKEKIKDGTIPVKILSAAPTVLTPNKPAIKDAKVVAELIKFVEKNSDFTIGTLSELAKKEFKSYTKSMLKHTIQEVACYNKKRSVWEIKQTT